MQVVSDLGLGLTVCVCVCVCVCVEGRIYRNASHVSDEELYNVRITN